MRERTPSADDNPTRAPPAPPREAALADVAGSKAANVTVEAFGIAKSSSGGRMVASTHSLEELGVGQPVNASNEKQQQEKHVSASYKSAQTAQDKRSRLSNVINNLRKKVPPDTRSSEDTLMGDDRNSVERNLETLEKYVMTVLNGVIREEEGEKEQQSVDVDGAKDDLDEVVPNEIEVCRSNGADGTSDHVRNIVTSLVPCESNEDKLENVLPKGDEEVDEERSERFGVDIKVTCESEDVDSLVRTSSAAENESEVGWSRDDLDCFGKVIVSEDREDAESIVDLAEDAKRSRSDGRCSSRGDDGHDEPCDETDRSLPTETTDRREREKRHSSLGNNDVSLDEVVTNRLSDCRRTDSDEEPDEEEGNEKNLKAEIDNTSKTEDMELRTICRELLSDLLNNINQLIGESRADQVEEVAEEKDRNEDSRASSDQSESSSTTSLHCSLPLDKVASILQNCQTSSEQATTLKTSLTKPPSPIVRHLCLYCDRKFLSISLRQRHTERVHQVGGGRRSKRNYRRASQNCQYCSDKCDVGLDELFRHMVVNHGDKYHACVQCTTRYVTREGLVNHMLDVHGTSTEKTIKPEKVKNVVTSCKEKAFESIKSNVGGCSKYKRRQESDAKAFRNDITMQANRLSSKDTFSNPGSPEFDSSFYSSVSCNIRENLLHHLDGKLQPNVASTSLEVKPSLYEHNVNQIQFPIDISLTAATPVYSKEYPAEDYENSSEYAQKPGKTRTHPRRVSFEKYNFPRKYDGKEQWTCSIKDLSKFDISTQLSLRKKQQLIKERITLSRLHQIPLLGPGSKLDGAASQTDLGSGQRLTDAMTEDQSIGRCSVEKLSDIAVDPTIEVESIVASSSGRTSPRCSTLQQAPTSIDTKFNAEFGNFMRLRKWEDNASESSKSQEVTFAELTGEWSRPRVYICGACAARHVTLKEMEEHKATSHPNVWCSHFEFAGDQRELYKHLFLPGRSIATLKARSAILTEKICTKCSKNCSTLAELHRHMLECGGDQAWLLGFFGNGKKKCKWRPFGSRSRRRRQRGMKRNIQNSQSPRVNVQKERPPSGPRVRPSDRESIQKMLANLPPKRASRKVLQNTATRTRNNSSCNVQTRSRPRLTTESSSAFAFSRNKAALRNKLLKNAKSFQRNRCRIDNIAAVIESVVRNCSVGNNYAEEEEEEAEEEDDEVDEEDVFEGGVKVERNVEVASKTGRYHDNCSARSRTVKGAKTLSKRKYLKAKDVITKNAEHPKIRGRSMSGTKLTKSKVTSSRSVVEPREYVFSESASVFTTDSNSKSTLKSGKGTASKSAENLTENASTTNEVFEFGRSNQATKNYTLSLTSSSSISSSFSKRRRTMDPVVLLNASLKTKTQLRVQNGKCTRGPSKRSTSAETALQVVRTRSQFVNRSKPSSARSYFRTSRRTTRFSSDSDKMPTLEPAVELDSDEEVVEEEVSTNELPILTPVATSSDQRGSGYSKNSVFMKIDSGSRNPIRRSRNTNELDLDEVLEKSVIDVAEVKDKANRKEESQGQGRGRRRRRRRRRRRNAPAKKGGKNVAVGSEVGEDDTTLTNYSLKGTSAPSRQLRVRNKRMLSKRREVPVNEDPSEKFGSAKDFKTKEEDSIDVIRKGVQETKSNVKVKQDQRGDEESTSPNESLNISETSVKRLLNSTRKKDLSGKLDSNSHDKNAKRSLRPSVSRSKLITRIRNQGDSVVDERQVDSDQEQRSDSSKVRTKRKGHSVLRKSPRNIEKKAIVVLEKNIRITKKGDDDDESKIIFTGEERFLRPKCQSTKVCSKDEVQIKNVKTGSSYLKTLGVSLVDCAEKSVLNTDDSMPDSSPSLKVAKRGGNPGKRQGRVKSTCLESTHEVNDFNGPMIDREISVEANARSKRSISTIEEHGAGGDDDYDDDDDMDGNSFRDLISMELVNLGLEHLHQESNNSNIDSGKENSSETPVNIPKVKTVRPKRSKGVRKEKVTKRTLSNVIGILTEGVNIPVEAQQSVVLTVQTAVEGVNSESAVQNHGQPIRDNNIVASGLLNLDGGDKSVENDNVELGTAASSDDAGGANVIRACREVSDEQTSKKVPGDTSAKVDGKVQCSSESSESSEVLTSIRKVDEDLKEQPANDIILDLTRRKPKGKGSFLEKIVSKIAKQKDALLEGEVGSLLDNAADELTSILDEVGPTLMESTESLNAISDKSEIESQPLDSLVELKDSKSLEGIEDDEVSKVSDGEDVRVKVIESSGEMDIAGSHVGQDSGTDAVDNIYDHFESMSVNKEHDEDGESGKARLKCKSKKRSLEINQPKKSKRKSVEAEASLEEENNIEEELCLADIMKLIQRSRQDDATSMNEREELADNEDIKETVRPGKRKVENDEKRKDSNVGHTVVLNEGTSEIESNEIPKRSKRKSNKKQLQSEELSSSEVEQSTKYFESEDRNIQTNEKASKAIDRGYHSTRRSGQKSLPDNVFNQSEDDERTIENSSATAKRMSKRKSLPNENFKDTAIPFHEDRGFEDEFRDTIDDNVPDILEYAQISGEMFLEKTSLSCEHLDKSNVSRKCEDEDADKKESVLARESLVSEKLDFPREISDEFKEQVSSVLDVIGVTKLLDDETAQSENKPDSNVSDIKLNPADDQEKNNDENIMSEKLDEITSKTSSTEALESSKKRSVKRKSLADEHLELPEDKPKIVTVVDGLFKQSETFGNVVVASSREKCSKKRSVIDDIVDDVKSSSSSCNTQNDISVSSLQLFKVPEVTEVLQHTKKRTIKKKSLTDEQLDLSDGTLQKEQALRFDTDNVAILKSTRNLDEDDSEGQEVDTKKSGTSSTNRLKENDRTLKSLEGAFDGTDKTENSSSSTSSSTVPSPRRRSSKRKNLASEQDVLDRSSLQDQSTESQPSDLSDASFTSELGCPIRRRSSKRKHLVDDSREPPDDVPTDNSITDSESIDADKSSGFERRRTPKRKAKKNIFLVDEHLDLLDDIGVSEEFERIERRLFKERDERKVPEEPPRKEKMLEERVVASDSLKVSEGTREHVNEALGTLTEPKANEEGPTEPEDPSKEDFQTPKKRASGNFAVVHTKSGEILIVEKKKKLTKEAPRFFCDVCATSFTRKSSLKKHNLSQSHMLQMTKFDKEQDKEMTEDSSEAIGTLASDYLEESSENNGNVKPVTENSSDEQEIVRRPGKDPEDTLDNDNAKTSLKKDTFAGVDISIGSLKTSLSAHLEVSEKEALEDELLDEEICKITENMTHEEYVLTDHVSPVFPEASLPTIKVPSKKAQQKFKRKSDQTKAKKKNLAEEHLNLDSPEPAKDLDLLVGSRNERSNLRCSPNKGSSSKSPLSELSNLQISKNTDSGLNTLDETIEGVACLDLHAFEKTADERVNLEVDKTETLERDLSRDDGSMRSGRDQSNRSFEEFEESLRSTRRDGSSLSKLDLYSERLNLGVYTPIESSNDRKNLSIKKSATKKIHRAGLEDHNEDQNIMSSVFTGTKNVEDFKLNLALDANEKLSNDSTINPNLAGESLTSDPVESSSRDKPRRRRRRRRRRRSRRSSSPIEFNEENESSKWNDPTLEMHLNSSEKSQRLLDLEETNKSSESSFADKPLSEFLSKVSVKSARNSSEDSSVQLTRDFSNIAKKLKVDETSVTNVNCYATIEFNSNENSLTTGLSVNIQKHLNDSEVSTDNRRESSQSFRCAKDDRVEGKANHEEKKIITLNKNVPKEKMTSDTSEAEESESYPAFARRTNSRLPNHVAESKVEAEGKIKGRSDERESPCEIDNCDRRIIRSSKAAGRIKENNRKSRDLQLRNRRKLQRNRLLDESSESESENEDRIESRNKNKIVKSVFGRVFSGEKVDKVKEVLDDWDSRSGDDSRARDSDFVREDNADSSLPEDSNFECKRNFVKHRSGCESNDSPVSPCSKRRSMRQSKRYRSESSKGSNRDCSAGRKRLEDRVLASLSTSSTDVILPNSRYRQSKKRAEERISKAFEEDSLGPTEGPGSRGQRSPRCKEISYELRNQSKSALCVTPKNDEYHSDEPSDTLDDLQGTFEQPSDQEKLGGATRRRRLTTSKGGSGSGKNRKRDEDEWDDFMTRSKQTTMTTAKSKADRTLEMTRNVELVSAASEHNDTSNENFTRKIEEPRATDFALHSGSVFSPIQSSVRNESPVLDRNSRSSLDSLENLEEEEDMTRGKMSPLLVRNTADSSLDTASTNSDDILTLDSHLPRKRSSSEFSGEKVVPRRRSPMSYVEDRSKVMTMTPTDAIEDNALDIPQKPMQGKVLNFDEELFVECCSRLKATTENELRGAKKIKLDHSDGFHRKDGHHQTGFRSTRDRWKDVESQNSLGSLLESVNQLLGEEMYSTQEKDYTKRVQNLHSENSSRSGSPDPDVSPSDNLGYEDSLDVAFEHNNKLRDKIQQRMRESENLIASTFGQRNVNNSNGDGFDHLTVRKNNEHEQNSCTYGNVQDRLSSISNSNPSNGDCVIDSNIGRYSTTKNITNLDSSSFKTKMNSALGGLLDKALSNLLHSNGKQDHNGSTPMKVLAELACARAPTSTNPEVSRENVQMKIASTTTELFLNPSPVDITKDPLTRKIRNPIKELFERKKELNERKQSEKTRIDATLRELNVQRQRKTKVTRKRQDFPLIRKNQHGGFPEKKKRWEPLDRKEESVSERIKDVYDFDEEESQMETEFGSVMPFRSKMEKSYEVSCLRTKEVDVAGLMSKAIDETLENGKEGDALGKRLESMIDEKFKEMEKFAPKTKGALKLYQNEDKQEITGPMDEFVERKQRSKRTAEQIGKHSRYKRKNRNAKRKSRNAWYENDSSDEFRTAAKTEDVGVGISKSQRTCSKGKQNLFAELSSSTESEFEDEEEEKKEEEEKEQQQLDDEGRRRSDKKTSKKVVQDLGENVTMECLSEVVENESFGNLESVNEYETRLSKSSRNEKEYSERKKSESETSDHPLVIDERKESDEQRNSDDDGDADNQYNRSFELDDLYREDSSVSESDLEEMTPSEQIALGNSKARRSPNNVSEEKSRMDVLRNKYTEENELIPLEEALDLLDRSDDLKGISEKTVKETTSVIQQEGIRTEVELSNVVLDQAKEFMKCERLLEEGIDEQQQEQHREDLTELPEKLSSNEKPQSVAENLPLHVFLSRKVQESKKRKQQQLKKLQEEQERILLDLQPTRRQRKCAIGKQGLLAEISSSDEEFCIKERTDRRSGDRSDHSRPRKQKRESKEKRKERYIEKKHEQIIAKEQKAIEEEILRELEKRKDIGIKDTVDFNEDGSTKTDEIEDDEADESNKSKTDKVDQKRRSRQKQKKSMEEFQDNVENKNLDKPLSETENNCDKSEQKLLACEDNPEEDNDLDFVTKQRKPMKPVQKTKRSAKSDGKAANGSRKRRNSSNGKDSKERRSSSTKRDSDDEELRTTRSWNKVEEGVGVAIGRRKRAAANQLYYWSSSSDEEELIEPTTNLEEEEDDRQEQHGWIVGDSHKKMITMLAMEKQLKEKRRRSEDEFEPGKTKSKKHRNSTS